MEANDFTAKLKADTPEKCMDLCKGLEEYRLILTKLPAKDRGVFGLNVLRILCWNLDKSLIWRNVIDNTALLTLTIECVRETRQMGREDRVKTLTCINHLHKYAVRLNKSVAPELVLKISGMPFELDSKYLLKEHHKTYWNILSDRFLYVEKLKTKCNITKLLPKFTSDIIKGIEIYDSVQFCSTILVFTVKKLHLLYSESNVSLLLGPYKQIFTAISMKDDIGKFKELTEEEIFDIYGKLNDCLYSIAVNVSNMHFDGHVLDAIAQNCAKLIEHRKDMMYCLQVFFKTLFCKIIAPKTDVSCIEKIFIDVPIKFQEAENLGYHKALHATYPYLDQILRRYIEYNVTNNIKFTEKIQESYLNLILIFTSKFKHSSQILRCENCPKKTGLHDAFRVTLCARTLVQNPTPAILAIYDLITTEQYILLEGLKNIGCTNYHKYFRKLQTDTHNTAINFNKSQLYDASIKLFDTYLSNELNCAEIDHKNISRVLFNKSICESDSKLFEKALIDAYLSLIFAWQEDLSVDKYMSLVMDIKDKALKSKSTDDEDTDMDKLQSVSVVDACKMALDNKMYGDLSPYMTGLKFSKVLRHEFAMYAKIWPSVAPIGGVWRALYGLVKGQYDAWITVENEAVTLEILYDVILESLSVVRTIHCTHLSTIVEELVEDFDNMTTLTPDEKLVHASLLFLQCEYDLAGASKMYGWKITETSTNPDNLPVRRTVPHEHAATRRATAAHHLLRDLMPLRQVSRDRLRHALQLFQVFVPLLQQLRRDALALQLAHHCCLIADIVQDRESYLRNLGVVLTSGPPSRAGDAALERAAAWGRGGWGAGELAFLCDVAIYYKGQGDLGMAARLVQAARSRILNMMESQPELNLDLAIGRLLEAQYLLYGDSSDGVCALTAVNALLKHYVPLKVTGNTWSSRRLHSLTIRAAASRGAARACGAAAALGLRPRGRSTAAAALLTEAAPGAAALLAQIVDVTAFQGAQTTIDSIQEILGLENSSCGQNNSWSTEKQLLFTPTQELESMRNAQINTKTQFETPSPVPGFEMPDFLNHDMECSCFACDMPVCVLLSCKSSNIQASMYAFANELEIARNYFKGAADMMLKAYKKLNMIKKKYTEIYDDFVVESVFRNYDLDLKSIEIRLLIDTAFFDLKNKDFNAADERLIEINDILLNTVVDKYLKNDVLNLMAASTQLKTVKKPLKKDTEVDFDLSPVKDNKETEKEPPLTPEARPIKPPKPATKIVVNTEELHQKRIKQKQLILDDEDDFEEPKPVKKGPKKDNFKVPIPIIPKPALEVATPRPLRSKPRILVTEPTLLATPDSHNDKENLEFFTPITMTPEVFFTPMTSTKTYSKKSLSQNIVKNLGQEFLTPGSAATSRRIGTSKVSEGKTVAKEDKSKQKAEKSVAREEKSQEKVQNSVANGDKSKQKIQNSGVKEDKSKQKVEKSVAKEEKLQEKAQNAVVNQNSVTKEGKSKQKVEKSVTKEEKSKQIAKNSVKIENKSKQNVDNSLVKDDKTKQIEENSRATEDKLSTKEARSKATEKSVAKEVKPKDIQKSKREETSQKNSAKIQNVPEKYRNKKEEKRTLVRAVSPGKIDKLPEKVTRSRRQI